MLLNRLEKMDLEDLVFGVNEIRTKSVGNEEQIFATTRKKIGLIDRYETNKRFKKNIHSFRAFTCTQVADVHGEEIAIRIATENNKPTFSCNLDGVKKGALAGEVANFADIGEQSGSMAHKILEGKDVRDMKTEGPDSVYKIINLKTAELLGIEISKELEYTVSQVVR